MVEVDEQSSQFFAANPGTPAGPGTGSISVSGTELSQQVQTQAGAPGTKIVNITGSEQHIGRPVIYDSGSVDIIINGYDKGAGYHIGSTSSTIASAIANAFQGDPNSPVYASASAQTITFTARVNGASTNYAYSSAETYDDVDFFNPSFGVSSASGVFSGGQDAVYQTVWDSGTTNVTVNGHTTATSWAGQGTTASSIASAIAQNINNDAAAFVTASASGSTVNMQSKATGSGVNYSYSTSTSSSQGSFSSSGSSSMIGTAAIPPTPAHYVWSFSPGYKTYYGYDALGNLLSVNQIGDGSQAARVRSFSYDSLSRLLSATNPESGRICYGTVVGTTCQNNGYDADGNLIYKTDARGILITYGYDQLHRLTGKTYSNGDPAVGYTYDSAAVSNGIGRRTGMTDASGTTSWGYDALGRETLETRTIAGITKQIGHTYNADGSIASLTYPSGKVVNYSYSAGRSRSAIDSSANISFAASATYVPPGMLGGMQSGVTSSFSGITTSNAYNKRLQPTILAAASPSLTVMSFSYDFGLGTADNGNVLNIMNNRDTTRSQSFTYDQVNRLLTAQNAGTDCAQTFPSGQKKFWGSSFVYDAWGNLTQKQTTKCTAEPFSAAANAQNQLVGYAYDAAGNMTTGGYVYDAENRIAAIGSVNYVYDGDGARVKKSSGKLYWGAGPLAETDLSGNIANEYIFFGGKRIARRDATGAVHYYFADHLGSSNVITTAAGAIEEESDFFPFGGEINVLSNGSNRYKFTGKERDSESALDYFGARYHNSSMGRFMTADPILISRDITDPQTWNKYSYTFNRPIALTDPDGAWPLWYHHIINRDTFGNLGAHSVAVLNAASDWMDDVGNGNQAPERSFMHAMRDGVNNQTIDQAMVQTKNFVGTEIQAAVDAQLLHEKNGGQGYSDDALTHFGHAAHTLEDATSPQHVGYQPWYCYYCPQGMKHGTDERHSAASSNPSDMEARYQAHVAAAQAWARFQSQLEAARKKEKQQGGKCDNPCPTNTENKKEQGPS